MKKIALSAVSLVALTTSVLAADLPSRKAAPIIAPPPPPMWTGFHVGVNAGGIWNNNNSIQVSTWPSTANSDLPLLWAPLNGSINSGSNGGFIGGGQVGYDWQVPYGGLGFVTGVEADIQGIAASSGNQSRNTLIPYSDGYNSVWNNVRGSANLQYLGTVRGRLGYLVTPTFLVYGTGGLAYGGVSANVYQAQFNNLGGTGGTAAFGNGNYSNTQVGYAAGGGVEWMFLPNWSAKAEYLYYNLGNISMTSVMTANGYGDFTYGPRIWNTSTANTTISGNIVRAGVNYHFNWGSAPVVAKY